MTIARPGEGGRKEAGVARLEEYDALSGGRLSVHTLIVGCLLIFAVASAKAAYEHELPNAEIRMVDAGHFALDEQ